MLEQSCDSPGGLDPARLFAPIAGETVVGLAVSGGSDSLALMALFARWAPEGSRPRAIVYSLDHRLRAEAGAEAATVMRQARRLGLEGRPLQWTAEKPASGLQQAARMARYRLIGAAMAEDGASVLLTAHHRRDQAETVLMRLAHGSGVTGLGGMRAFADVEGIKIFRPLLAVSPEQLRAVVDDAGLAAVQDPSNSDEAYERVRWRKALPYLDALGLSEVRLAALAERLQRVDRLAEREADAFMFGHCRVDPLGVVHVSRKDLWASTPETAIRVLARSIAIASGRSEIKLGAVEALYNALSHDEAIGRTLSGARIAGNFDKLMIFREAGRMRQPPFSLVRGERKVWDNRFEITATAEPLRIEAAEWTRAGHKRATGLELDVPVAALRAAPVITDQADRIIALGETVFHSGVTVRGPALTACR